MPRLAAALLFLLVPPAPSSAGETGTSPVNALNTVESTRAQGFGGAAVAVGRDPTLVWVNPAAPALSEGASLTVGYQRGFFGDMAGQGIYSTPFRSGMLTFGVLYYDCGETSVYQPDYTLWTGRLQQDMMGAVGYTAPLSDSVTSGATFKYLRSTLAEQATSSAMAVDGGVQIRLSREVKIGLAVQNAGTKLHYETDYLALPTVARAGFALGFKLGGGAESAAGGTLIVLGDSEYDVTSGGLSWCGGVEYQWREMVALRVGARAGTIEEASLLSAGAGLKVGAYRLDYSIRFNRYLNMPQTLSLTIGLPRGASKAPAVTASAGPIQPSLPDIQTEAIPPAPEAAGKAPILSPTTAAPEPDAFPPPPPGDGGLIDDLNRQLDEFIQDHSK